MERIEQYVETLYEQRQQRELDVVLPIVGDEGAGKSTLIMQMAVKYLHYRDGDIPSIDDVLERIYYDRPGWKTAMAESEKQALIMIPDAARLLFSKDAMKKEQKEIEKDLMDVRGMQFFILLGFQDFDTIPSQVKERRAKNCLVVPERGLVRGYNRDDMDQRIDNGSWPQPTLRDRFPALDGTDLWEKYQSVDEEKKRERIGGNVQPDPEDVSKDEQRKVVLRAVQPWDEFNGMTQRDAAKLIDYSEGWVSNTIQDWRDGMYRDLVKPEEVKNVRRH
jgi:hypothetical protein